MDLLESLEARVDLMAQMQHTRAAIQKRAKALEGLKSPVGDHAPKAPRPENEGPAWQPTVEVLPREGTVAAPTLPIVAAPALPERRSPRHGQTWSAMDLAPGGSPAAVERPFVPSAPTMPLQPPKEGDEHGELWKQFQDQRDCIARLSGQVESMRTQLLHLGAPASPSASTTTSWSEVSTSLSRTKPLGRSLEQTQPVPPPGADLGFKLDLSGLTPPMQPFSSDMCGVNLELSQDGFGATRTRGCRQAAAIGAKPLQAGARGYFFEVTVEETVTGWVGGLGIGVTATPPNEVRRVPDKAWRMPNTFMVGYWGCIFLDGVECRTSWRSDSLVVGSVVGLLVTKEGDILVFVDGHPVVRVAHAVPEGLTKKLYPVADVFAATKAITLSKRGDPPPPPWCVEAAAASRAAASPRSCLGSALTDAIGPTCASLSRTLSAAARTG